jgi:Met-zincin
MRMKSFRWLGLVALTLLVGFVSTLAGGCAQSRDPINRVQAGALDKHFFVGTSLSDTTDDPEFYMGTRIIDEPYGVGQGFFMFQSMGGLARVKWEVQESLLIARLTYERVQNSDYHGSQSTNTGQIVAEFVIESQFDIKRDYNTQTGEQLNVIVENTTDRPWYERDYFRVDWSKNLVTDAYDFDIFAQGALLEGVQYDPGSYYVQDPSDPNAPVFSPDDGYFDVTTKVTARPQVLNTPYGAYPVCFFFGSYPAVTCDPAEVTVRISFKKLVDDDYEPEDWTGTKMNAFGWFTQDRLGYDRNYGILDQNWHRFASRYNIWQKSHVDGTQCAIDAWRDASGNVQNYKVDTSGTCTGYAAPDGTCFVTDPNSGLPIPDPNGLPFTRSSVGLDVHRDTDGDGTEDECQFTDALGNVVNPGSRCDEFKNKCDIPLYLRNTKTTPLYYGPAAAADLFASTAQALNSWNLAVKRSVQLGKVVEANRASVDVGQEQLLTSEADLIQDQQNPGGPSVPDIFVLCHNPVSAEDSRACGPPGLAARLGDLRYSVVNIIQDPQMPSAWGIMTDFDDPLTGEKVQGSINEWGYVLDTATQNVEDLLRWLNGEITNDQIANGQYLQQWVNASKLGVAQYSPAVLSQAEIASRLASIDKTIANLNGLQGAAQPAASSSAQTTQRQAQRFAAMLGNSSGQALPSVIASQLASNNLAQVLGPSMDAQLEATRQQLMGSQWEGQLLTPNVLQWGGFNPQQPFAGDPTTLAMASPLRGLNPKVVKWGKDILTTGMIAKNMCVLEDEPEPDSLVALARQAKQLYPLPSASDPNYAAEVIQHDQALHQWIREQFHRSVIAHEMGHSMGLRHNFAGSFDALNYHTEYWQLRTRNGQEKACPDATTPHTNGADCVGPRWIDPVTDQETNGFIWKWASTTVMDYPGDQTQDMNDIGLYDKAAMRFGYADIVDVEKSFTSTSAKGKDYLLALDGFGGIWGSSLGSTVPRHYSTYNDTYNLLGTCTDRPAWNGDPADPLHLQCSGANLDYVATRDMKTVDKFSPQVTAVRPDLVANFAVDPQNRVRHPYMFGSDEFADVGNIPVFRFDAGADSYEQAQFLISTYENRYIFNNFRRNNVLFNTAAVNTRTETRYWDKIQALTKSLALGIELNTSPGNDPTTSPGFLMPLALGSADGLAMFVRALTRPAPGSYVVQPAAGPGGPPNAWGTAWQLGDLGLLSAPPTTVNVALGDGEGRFIQNDYDYTQGYWWSEYQKQVGSYFEKLLAPMYLTEAYNNFVSNSEDDYIDGRYKNLSYASIYPNQIRRIFANLMATQSGIHATGSSATAQIFTLAPYSIPATTSATTNPSTQVQYLPWDKYDPSDSSTTSLQYPPGAVLLDPLVDWEQQYPALINLFWFGPTSLSMDLIDQMRIFSPGDAASLSLSPDQQVRYRDPLTGIEYVAKNYGTEVVNPNIGFQTAKSIGARMLQHANDLASRAYQVTNPPDPTTGELTYDTDGQGNPIPLSSPDAQALATMLKGYASNIDVVRQLTLFFGYGPLGH